jgi:hypothetical protein
MAARSGATLSLLLLTALAGCDESAPEAEAITTPQPIENPPAAEPPPPRLALPYGRWTSETVCLELYETGDIEVVFRGGPGPKTLVMGSYEARQEGGSFALVVRVGRIWNTRFSSRCRRVHRFGEFVEEHRSDGLSFRAGEQTELDVTTREDGDLQLCQAGECVRLTPEDPVLSGTWRMPDFENPSRPPRALIPGEVVELDLGRSPHVWLADSATSFTRHDASFERTAVRHGEFRIAISSEEALPRALGSPLTARRIREQRLDVCTGEGRCNTLERQFSGSEYDLP